LVLEREGAGYVQVTELLYRIAEQSPASDGRDIAESIRRAASLSARHHPDADYAVTDNRVV